MKKKQHLHLVPPPVPQSPEVPTELALLGQAILDMEFAEKLCDVAKPQYFSLQEHIDIFQAIAAVVARRELVDVASVARELHANGRLVACGGHNRLLDAVRLHEAIMPENLEFHVAKLRDSFTKRQTIALAQVLASRGHNPKESAEEYVAAARDAFSTMEVEGEAPLTIYDVALNVLNTENARYNGLIAPNVITTGLPSLDRLIGDIEPETLITLGADPGAGKTALAMQVSHHVAKTCADGAVAIASLEVSPEKLVLRWAANVGKVALGERNTSNAAGDRFMLALDEVGQLPVSFFKGAECTLEALRAWVREINRGSDARKVRFLVVDHLHFCTLPEAETFDRSIAMFTRGLKRLAKEFSLTVLLLVPLNRDKDKGSARPQVRNLKGSSSIESDSDQIWFIYRMFQHIPDKLSGKAHEVEDRSEIIVAKNREGGTGTVLQRYVGAHYRFEEPSEVVEERWQNALTVKAHAPGKYRG